LLFCWGKGDHQITSSWINPNGTEIATTLGFTRSNIILLGVGKGATTILGGFRIENLENITFKNMTVTNTSDSGHGIYMKNAKVELVDVALKGCFDMSLYIPSSTSETTTLVATRCEFANSDFGAVVQGSLTSATFNNCIFHDNTHYGFFGHQSTIHLRGEATAIHSNGVGINASHSAKVIIHHPSNHNTSYNNKGQDRETESGGTITNVED